MDAHCVEILDRADDDNVVVDIPHDLEFVFFPTHDRDFDQDLVNRTQLETACDNLIKLFTVVGDATP